MLSTFACIGALVLPTGSFDGGLPIAVSDIVCEGSLLNCSVSVPPGVCESGDGAAVVCQGETVSYLCACLITFDSMGE